MKRCGRCKIEKESSGFYTRSDGMGGPGALRSVCKQCFNNQVVDNTRKLRVKNPDRVLNRYRKYRKSAKGKEKTQAYDSLPEVRMRRQLRRRILHALDGDSKSEATLQLLGCSMDQFLGWIEVHFEEGMTWDNQGKWHIDHKHPCINFNLQDPEQQKECFHYTNLQPLWARDNLRKATSVNFRKEG
jgi:hypothetical protein